MGFLTDGDTLVWEDSVEFHQQIKRNGVAQLKHIFDKYEEMKFPGITWGDEVEYLLIEVDDENRTVKLKLRGGEVLHTLQEPERMHSEDIEALWRPEYGAFMIEGTPAVPFTYDINSLCTVEDSMKRRRALAQELLHDGEYVITLPNFPLLGSGEFATPWSPPGGPIAGSKYTPDEVINPHKRFGTLTNNIKRRRGSNVAMNMPLFMDENTKDLTYRDIFPDPATSPALDNHIYMDSMAFGMGMCCLQTTFQTVDITEGRYLYDQFLPLTPIMLALTASTPIFRGYLADVDVRWNVISGAVDDRTPAELGKVESDTPILDKSRYAPVSLYLAEDVDPAMNDINVVVNQDTYDELIDAGFDPMLARHFAHLFIRDPLVIYEKKIDIDDKLYSDHFENIQSTNWQSARFKPPAPNTNYGWRIEFRTMEIQLTDFANAAFAVFSAIMTRVILDKHLNLYIPISKVDENMSRAHSRGACLNQKFFYKSDDGQVLEYTVDQVINGTEGLTGIGELVRDYIRDTPMEEEQRTLLNSYCDLVSKRASGELCTVACWIRKFVDEHPEYKKDSVVTESINYDLMKALIDIETGVVPPPPELLS